MKKSKPDNRKPPTHRKSCGTTSGVAMHARAGERTCEACKTARNKYQKDYRRRRNEATAKSASATAPKTASTNATAPTPGTPLSAPAFLKKEGLKLWNELTSTYTLSPGARILAIEACRLTDRLERFAAALSSSSTLWFELEESVDDNGLDDGRHWTVSVNGLLGEARQTQAALRTTLKQLGLADAAPIPTEEEEAPAPSALDQLAARRKERLKGVS